VQQVVPESKDKRVNIGLLRRVIQLANPFRKLFVLAAVLSIIIAPVSSVRPYLFQVMVDDYVVPGDYTGLNRIALLIFGLLVLEVGLRYLFIFSTNLLGQSIIKQLRDRVFSHITSMPLKHFDKTPIGTSTTRAINDIEAVNAVFTQGVITIVADILSLIAVLVIMFQSSWQLTLICLSTLPLLMLAVYVFKEKVRIAFQKVRNHIATMNAFLQERITGMRIVQLFTAEEKEAEKFRKINKEYTQANIDSIFHYSVFFPAVEIISALSLGLMVWWGASGVLEGKVTLGALIAFPVYLTMLFRPVRFMADKFNTLQMGMVAAERVFNLLDMQPESIKNGTVIPKKLKGELEFKNVWFGYEQGVDVLKDLSFNVKPGQTMAIVGSTGSGKSTIIQILNRFYEWDRGEITLDGISLKAYDKNALRSRMAMVLQDVFLFSGSILDNIRLNDSSISPAKVYEACAMIKADAFIKKLPGGYDFQVSERGSNLSTGQRQMLAFARALVYDPDILILDEATSSIDSESEALIQFAIETLISKRTALIIAHRLSTIRHAHQIMVMEKGKMVECGNHEELLQKEHGRYKTLYEIQFLQESI
jgi:ATP-binding cassette, subfamily B, multidrug efflux pump